MHQKEFNARQIYLEGIRDGNIESALEKYVGERYTQHNADVRDGKDGFIEFLQDFVQRNPIREIEINRSFVDDKYVFVHAYQNLNEGAAQYVTMDFFDTDDKDRLVEH